MDYVNRKKVEKSPNDKFFEEKKVRRDRNVKELGKNEKNTSIAKKRPKAVIEDKLLSSHRLGLIKLRDQKGK